MHYSGSLFEVSVQTLFLIWRDQDHKDFYGYSHTLCQRRAGMFFLRSASESGKACTLPSTLLAPGVQSPSMCSIKKKDMQLYWSSLIIYLVELSQCNHQSVFVLKKKPHSALLWLERKISKCSTSKILRYIWISNLTYSTFVFHWL